MIFSVFKPKIQLIGIYPLKQKKLETIIFKKQKPLSAEEIGSLGLIAKSI